MGIKTAHEGHDRKWRNWVFDVPRTEKNNRARLGIKQPTDLGCEDSPRPTGGRAADLHAL